MHSDPALLAPIVPGIRRVWVLHRSVGASITVRHATPVLPARSILRSILFVADVDLGNAAAVTLRLVAGGAAAPAASDFVGTGLILPDISLALQTADYTADPAIAATELQVNFRLPNQPVRLMAEILNGNLDETSIKLRCIIDSIARLGDDDGRR